MTYEKRWDEKRWAGIRWEELRWDEVWSVKSAVWSVGREECSVKCGVWSVECEVWSVECAVGSVQWSVKCGLGRVQCEVRSVECEVWSVQCGVWRVQWEVWRAKWSFKCDMWNRTPLSQSARTHGLGWRTARASSIDEKSLIYIFKATSAPPRAGTTGNKKEAHPTINQLAIEFHADHPGLTLLQWSQIWHSKFRIGHLNPKK